jgi:hypothetical protein
VSFFHQRGVGWAYVLDQVLMVILGGVAKCRSSFAHIGNTWPKLWYSGAVLGDIIELAAELQKFLMQTGASTGLQMGFSFAFRVHGFRLFFPFLSLPHIPYKTCPNCDYLHKHKSILAFLITFFKNFASSVDHMGERRCC